MSFGRVFHGDGMANKLTEDHKQELVTKEQRIIPHL